MMLGMEKACLLHRVTRDRRHHREGLRNSVGTGNLLTTATTTVVGTPIGQDFFKWAVQGLFVVVGWRARWEWFSMADSLADVHIGWVLDTSVEVDGGVAVEVVRSTRPVFIVKQNTARVTLCSLSIPRMLLEQSRTGGLSTITL